MLAEVTHGVTAVAELKPPEFRPTIGRAKLVTHGVTAVAELKPLIDCLNSDHAVRSPTASPPWPN